MYDLNLANLFVSFAITWAIGLLPPVLLRYAILRRPINKWPAIGTCAFFFLGNIILFMALGSESKTHSVLVIIAYVSYLILRRGASIEDEPEKVVESRDKEAVAPSPMLIARSTRHGTWNWMGWGVQGWVAVLGAAALALSLIFPPWEITSDGGVSMRIGYGTLLGPTDKQVRPMVRVCGQADEALAAAKAYAAALAEYVASGEAARDDLAFAAEQREAESKGDFILGGNRSYTSAELERAQKHAEDVVKNCASSLTELKSRAGISFSLLLTQIAAIAGLALFATLLSRAIVTRRRADYE